MLKIGQFNTLTVLDTRDNGAMLDAGESRRVFLPRTLSGDQTALKPGDEVEVFIYLDSDGLLAATTGPPLAQVGQVAWLKILDMNATGAFADWGLPKDLFIPFAEQQHPLREGQHSLVKVYLDNQNRIAGSTRIDHWISDDASGLSIGEQVAVIIGDKTELGFKAVINHRCWGLLYSNELFKRIRKGQTLTAYVKQLRADNKVDLTLNKPGFDKGKVEDISQQIINQLEAQGGHLSLTDKSPPPEIYAAFGVSKKVFKQALGALYKQRRVSLDAEGISLLKD